MDAFEILVIILSVFLAIFLLLAIIAISLIIALAVKAKKIISTVGFAADNLETFSYRLSKMIIPAGIFKILASIIGRK